MPIQIVSPEEPPVEEERRPTLQEMKRAYRAGAKRGDPLYEERLDLNKSGKIDLADIVMFGSRPPETVEELKERYGWETDIPEGSRITELRKTEEGYEIEYEPPGQPKPSEPSLSERILQFIAPLQTAELPKFVDAPELKPVTGIRREQIAFEVGGFAAGAVASVEAPIYVAGSLVTGIPSRPPPTALSGLIQTAGGNIAEKGVDFGRWAESPEWTETKSRGYGYFFGTISGDILVSFVGGKVVSKAASGVVKITPKFVKEPIARVVGKARYRAGGWLAERSSWYQERVLKSLKHKPSLVSTPPKEPLVAGKGALSIQRMRVEQFFWEKPSWGMAEVWVTGRPSGRAVASAASKWAARTRVLTSGAHTPFRVTLQRAFQKEAFRKGGLIQPILAPRTETVKAGLKTIPYLPPISTVTKAGKALPFLYVPRPAPPSTKTVHRKLVETFTVPNIRADLVRKPKRITVTKPMVKMVTWPVQPSKHEVDILSQTMVEQQVAQQTKTVQRTTLKFLQVPRARVHVPKVDYARSESPVFEPWVPRKKKRKRGRKQRGVKWMFRVHPVAEPEQLLSGLLPRKRKA